MTGGLRDLGSGRLGEWERGRTELLNFETEIQRNGEIVKRRNGETEILRNKKEQYGLWLTDVK